jgi:hypothetical protein
MPVREYLLGVLVEKAKAWGRKVLSNTTGGQLGLNH